MRKQAEEKKKKELEESKDLTPEDLMKNWRGGNIHKLNALSLEKFDSVDHECEKYMELTEQERINLSQLKRFNIFEWFVVERDFDRGDAFGERAFIGANPEKQRRETTIKAREKTGLAVLSRQDFLKVLRKVKAQQSLDKFGFITNIPMFKSLKPKQLQKLINKSRHQSFKRNQIVFQQNTTASDLLIVYEGEFEILRNQKGSLISPSSGAQNQKSTRKILDD